uniref:RING finger and transmembrane domain-containing protein 1 n=1 Tax=Schistocephalus solidus TaxID=70667 RepID=A0A0X3NMG6_SCHSO
MLSFTLSPVTSYPKFMLSVPTDIVVPAALRHAKDSAPVQSMRKVFFSNPKNLFIAIPFLILFLLKIALEHSDGIWSVICLSMSFFYINQRIKNAACKFEPKWLACSTSAVGLLGLLCLQCAFRKEGVYRSLFCAPSYISSDDWVGLLWSILVTDFSLKLITMFLKSIVIALSPRPLGVYPRSVVLVWMEFASQIYRSIVPVVPWIRFLTELGISPRLNPTAVIVMFALIYVLLKIFSLWLLVSPIWSAFKSLNLTVPYSTVVGISSPEGEMCVLCFENRNQLSAALRCGHVFCKNCLDRWLIYFNECPVCSSKINDEFKDWRDGSTSRCVQLF